MIRVVPGDSPDATEDALYDLREEFRIALEGKVFEWHAERVGEVVTLACLNAHPASRLPEYLELCAVVRNNRYLTFFGRWDMDGGPPYELLSSGSLETDPTMREPRLEFAWHFSGLSSRLVEFAEEEDIDAELRSMTLMDWSSLEEDERDEIVEKYAKAFARLVGMQETDACVKLRELMTESGSYPSPEVADLMWKIWKESRYGCVI